MSETPHPAPKLVIGLLAAALAAPAFAQTTRPRSAPPDEREVEAPDGLLAGPHVEPESTGTGAPPFGAGQRDRPDVRPRRWLELYRTLDLDEARRTEARALVDDLNRRRRQFERRHGEEFRSLRQRARALRGTDRRPSDDDRRRLRELEALSPRPIECQKKLWDLLTVDQQEVFRAKLAEERDRIAAQRQVDRPRRLADVDRRRLEFLRARQQRRAAERDEP